MKKNHIHLSSREILEKVKKRQLTPEEGVELYENLKANAQKSAISNRSYVDQQIYYRVDWKRSEIQSTAGKKSIEGMTLIFDINRNIYDHWQTIDSVDNDDVILVTPSKSYRVVNRSHYNINPNQKQDYQKLFAELSNNNQLPTQIVYKWSEYGPLFENAKEFYSILYLVQVLMEHKLKQEVTVLYLYSNEQKRNPHCAAVSGFAQTVRLENPLVTIKTVELSKDSLEMHAEVCDKAISEFQVNDALIVHYKGQDRYIRNLQKFEIEEVYPPSSVLKEKGVYLITGGAGGLGLIFAEYIAKRTKGKLVLVGRSPLTNESKQKIQEIEALGVDIMYIQADICKSEDVEGVVHQTRCRFGKINGVIHSAGVIHDSFILKKDAQQVSQVLAPKLQGTLNLDEATKDDELDFFVLFSSITALIGNIGQSDYAYANHFMDHFVHLRSKMNRPGKSLSINWPFWEKGGMSIDQQLLEDIYNKMGVTSLKTESGLIAFEHGIQASVTQLLVVEGDMQKIHQFLGTVYNNEKNQEDDQKAVVVSDHNQLNDDIIHYLKRILSQEIKLPENKINAHAPLEKYGIDSVMVLSLTRKLEDKFGELSKTLFFEYQTIEEMSEYFQQHHKEKLVDMFGIKPTASMNTDEEQNLYQFESQAKSSKQKELILDSGRFLHQHTSDNRNVGQIEDAVAIIGVSGRYPMANDIEEYWGNLQNGRDCITEIPKERWDFREYYDPNKTAKGKSYSKWGGFIDDVDKFDPLFFNISPREAETMDPQERLYLEMVWKTIEDAGYTKEKLINYGNVGVYVGVMYGHYQLYGVDEKRSNINFIPDSSFSSIANRISYHFNFHGPSMAVDTMCSSSLTAIHLACESIRKGECETAIAGGVNVTIHPNKYLQLSKGNFVSTDGRCRSFGEGGDGYVPGEGVGSILLKPVRKALEDRDHIYAVIKGTSVNHGGKTNGYTVPNPNAQARLIADALRKANIDPRTISYIEAHGTGTALGDPIEMTGLTKAFAEHTKEKGFCSIGSVKSNIGHLESAAGIAGITKVLLQMKYKQLVPSIHSLELNPNIEMDTSPFYIQHKLEEWKRPMIDKNNVSTTFPLRSGISSFGAGGSNAHIIMEEHPNQHRLLTEDDEQKPCIMVLSAKNEERLRHYCQLYADFLKKTSMSLQNIAYTLQVGREAMEERLAMVVSNKKEFAQQLSLFSQGHENIEQMYRANVKNHIEREFLAEGEEGQVFIRLLVKNRKLSKLAKLWVSGEVIDWELLYQNKKPYRISLPTYPFARETYWVPDGGANKENNVTGKAETLHELLDVNESTLYEQRFKKVFTKNDPLVSDCVILEEQVVPSTVYLEMARVAGELANRNKRVTQVQKVKFAKPLVIKKEKQEVWVNLYTDEQQVYFEVTTLNDGDQKIVCAQGELMYKGVTIKQSTSVKERSIESIKERMTSVLKDQEFYAILGNLHLHYGPKFQVIKEYGCNQKEVYAHLQFSERAGEDLSIFISYPAFMEGILQTLNAWMYEISSVPHSYQLYSLGKMEIFSSVTEACYIHSVRQEAMESDEMSKVFDLFLYNENGHLVVSIKKMKLAVVQRINHYPQDTDMHIDMKRYMLSKKWRVMNGRQRQKGKHTDTVLMVVNDETRTIGEQIMDQWSASGIILDQTELGTDAAQRAIAGQDFQAAIDLSDVYCSPEAISRRRTEKLVLLQNVIKDRRPYPFKILHVTSGLQTFRPRQATLAGAEIAGIVKMLSAEYSHLQARTVDIDFSITDSDSWQHMLANEINIVDLESEICYRDGKRYAPYMEKVRADHQRIEKIEIDKEKVIVITGGTRGIGMEVAKHLASKGVRKLVLMGVQSFPPRDEWTNILQGQLADKNLINKLNMIMTLEKQGVDVYLYSGLLTEEDKLRTFFNEIREHGGEIGGIVHCAGVSIDDDPAFINKKIEDIDRVFEPKVTGLQTLHRVFAENPLDFFILFSSVSALIPALSVGVSDYAAANSFMDYFAAYQHSQGYQYYLSINWPSWREAGMGEVTSPVYRQMGLLAHSTADGLAMFDHAMEIRQETCMPCLVNQNQFDIEKLLLVRQNAKQVGSVSTGQEEKKHKLLINTQPSKYQEWLTELFSSELRIPKEKLDENTDFGEFGVDSILLVDLVKKVEKRLGTELEPSVFLEYPTLKTLSEFLTERYSAQVDDQKEKQTLVEHDNEQNASPLEGSTTRRSEGERLDFIRQPRKTIASFAQHSSFRIKMSMEKESVPPKIAVIGIGCHFPGAGDKGSYWSNLVKGKSGITEVPSTRWDVGRLYSPHHETGKSISKWGAFIDGIEFFDPEYFGISPEDAPQIDPLVRQFLEVSSETLRDAGYEQKELSDKQIGVFVGSRVSDYSSRITHLKKNSIVGTGQNFIGAYASHFFNFKGPNIIIDTACSSSLVSIHLACQSLVSGESEMALAGGVDILLDEKPYLVLSEGRALSPDGRCHTFDAKANGFVPGEGCGAVLLKPFEQALADGDQIYAVIDSTAVNNDGRTMGVTTPNEEEQRAVILEALRKAKIDPSSISYIETHGTGTMIGDPIELKALTKVFREFTDEKQFCGVGSVKTNIGHLLSAAGIASFIKVILALHHKKLPPTLNCETPNPRVEFSGSPFYPNTELENWEAHKGIRRTGISSFGFGGTNAHVIVSEADQQLVDQYQQQRQPLPPVQFKRKRYWLDKPDNKPQEAGKLPSLFELEII